MPYENELLQAVYDCAMHDRMNEKNLINKVLELLNRGANINCRAQPSIPFSLSPHYQDSCLEIAATNGNLELVKLLVERGADINSANPIHGGTPLHLSYIRVEIAEFLITKGAALEAKNLSGETPFLMAARCGNVDVVKLLMSKGANIDARDNKGNDGLALASNHYKPDNMSAISNERNKRIQRQNELETQQRERKKTEDTQQFFEAIKSNNLTKAKFYLDSGININVNDENGATALHWAARKGHADIVKFLLANKASINLTDNKGNTPLHWSVAYNKTNTGKLLLENNADVNIANTSQQTPMQLAKALGKPDMVALFNLGATQIQLQISSELTQALKTGTFTASTDNKEVHISYQSNTLLAENALLTLCDLFMNTSALAVIDVKSANGSLLVEMPSTDAAKQLVQLLQSQGILAAEEFKKTATP